MIRLIYQTTLKLRKSVNSEEQNGELEIEYIYNTYNFEMISVQNIIFMKFYKSISKYHNPVANMCQSYYRNF